MQSKYNFLPCMSSSTSLQQLNIQPYYLLKSLIWLITYACYSLVVQQVHLIMRGRGLRTKLLHNIEAVLQEHELVCSVMIVLEGVVHQVLLTYYKGNVCLHPLCQSASLSACRGDKEHRFKNGITQTPMCMKDVIA